ncbi:MAG: TonB-dependent receptor [Calditrichaeota bacterium]|nr:TonB-dependent receptor [Calditrichota bacterium]
MIRYITILLLGIAALTGTVFGEKISGTVYDANLGAPISYAEIILYQQEDSIQVTGTITGPEGQFSLENISPGTYMVEVYFLGYENRFFRDITVEASNRGADLGRIGLSPTVIASEAVEVEGRKPAISYQIDKKVISVDEKLTAVSGNAADVLENVPSVTVDIDGNVSLRGSSNFRVLIDGRPSVLDASDALQQIPASSIENIEIITNPSAKYDPEGTSGLINIVMKKNRRNSRSALLNLNAGVDDKFGGDLIYDMQSDKLSATVGLDYNRRFTDGSDIEEVETSQNGRTSFLYSEGGTTRGRISLGVRGSLAYKLGSADLFTLDFRYGNGSYQGGASLDYDEWSSAEIDRLRYSSLNDSERSWDYYASSMSYERRFAGQKHQLKGELYFSRRFSDESSLNERTAPEGTIISGQRALESGPSRQLSGRLDYSRPLGGEHRLEAGYQGQFNQAEDNTALYFFDPASGNYSFQKDFENYTDYRRTIHAVYGIYGGQWGRLGYQAGLRGEYTDRATAFGQTAPERFAIDRADLFPSAHFSYQFSDGQQLMGSYSRRIERPRSWYLEPFITYVDAYNLRSGNPALTPEYIDSYEIGFQTFIDKTLFSSEMYYRIGRDRIERVRSVYAENITIFTPENVGTDYALGSEIMLNLDVVKPWNVNLLGNLYNYRIEGTLYERPFSRESFNWNVRFNNSLRLTRDLQVQINTQYDSPTVSSQGRREGFFSADLALKQSLFAQFMTATLQVRDIFGTEKYERYSRGLDFYNYNLSDRESPSVMLNLRFNFNNYKQPREGGNRGGADDDF